VLVASGRRSIAGVQSYVAGADVYDPVTGSFTATEPMLPPTGEGATRAGHTATLLPGGKVLLAGGAEMFSSGAPPGFGFYTRAHLYDPTTGTFGQTGQTITYRQLHTATLLPNGKVLLAGGGSASAELYDPTTGAFTATGSMGLARGAHTATLLPSGRVLVAGGDSLSALPTAEVYDPATGQFTPTGAMTERRASHAATLLPDGAVLLTGGTTSLGGPSVCGSNRGAERWTEGEVRVMLSSPTTYACHQGFGATLGIANGSAEPIAVHGVVLDFATPGSCPGSAPDATWTYPPLVTTLAPGQTSTVLHLASAPYCCPSPGCTADSFYGAVYAFRISTSAGVLRATVSPVIDLRGCSEVCP
ncbi:MAG TPA: hypothetical protein PLL32_10135, partial [Anaeromyxobacteraceae bacterium]|nr:hypothetical protein [Anaeromyxobacteraceae bacterium]